MTRELSESYSFHRDSLFSNGEGSYLGSLRMGDFGTQFLGKLMKSGVRPAVGRQDSLFLNDEVRALLVLILNMPRCG